MLTKDEIAKQSVAYEKSVVGRIENMVSEVRWFAYVSWVRIFGTDKSRSDIEHIQRELAAHKIREKRSRP